MGQGSRDTTGALAAALGFLSAREGEHLEALAELVECSSGTGDAEGVARAQRLLSARVPLSACFEPCARFGPHALYETRAASERPFVLLVGHMDTVFPRELWTGFRREGGLGRGPGALDMKGGLALCAYALGALAAAGVLEEVPLKWAVVSDEEVGSPESAPWLAKHARGASAALVFEAGRPGDRVITRRKGTGSLTARAQGKAAHAGNAWSEGANAVWALARWIDRAQRLADPAQGLTVNVGVVRGGTSKNTVPAEAHAEVDLRYERAPQAAALWEALEEAARDAGVQGATVTLERGPGRAPMAPDARATALRERYEACQRAAGLGAGEMPLVGGGSDAQTAHGAGVPAIDGLGPRGTGFHTLQEQVELDSLRPKAEALVRFLLEELA